MNSEKVNQLLRQGEGIDIEFKTARFDLNKDIFDSICAFLNRSGGHLLLGVTNNGKVEGIIEDAVPAMINNLITSANNPGKLSPPVYLSPQVVEYEGKKLIYLYVPESAFIHATNGRVFDRNGDADVDITRQFNSIYNVTLRKYSEHMEDRVYPYVEFADLNLPLLQGVRIRAETRQIGHPWTYMTDEQLIRSAGLYKTDPTTGKMGITLAGVLLLGKDTTIFNVLPQHKTDAILRVDNLDRYDDRDLIRTNLIDSFDRLMQFIAKHLPDKFYLDGVHTISLRDRLFREIVSNLLIHREFTSRFPAKLIIQQHQVYTENWSIARGWGQLDPLNFIPYSKNPVIAGFFREVSRADELGSGVRNLYRFSPEYTPGTSPKLFEGDIFKSIVPLNFKYFSTEKPKSVYRPPRKFGGENKGENGGEKLGKSELRILQMIEQNNIITISELSKKLKIGTTTVETNISKLKKKGILERIGPDKGGWWKINR